MQTRVLIRSGTCSGPLVVAPHPERASNITFYELYVSFCAILRVLKDLEPQLDSGNAFFAQICHFWIQIFVFGTVSIHFSSISDLTTKQIPFLALKLLAKSRKPVEATVRQLNLKMVTYMLKNTARAYFLSQFRVLWSYSETLTTSPCFPSLPRAEQLDKLSNPSSISRQVFTRVTHRAESGGPLLLNIDKLLLQEEEEETRTPVSLAATPSPPEEAILPEKLERQSSEGKIRIDL